MIVTLTYTNPWIAKRRTLTLDVGSRGEGTLSWEGPPAPTGGRSGAWPVPPNTLLSPLAQAAAVLSRQPPWGAAALHPLKLNR